MKQKLPEVDWKSHKRAVLDNLSWDDRIVRHIVEKKKFKVLRQTVEGTNVITVLSIKPCQIKLEDTFMQ